MEINPACIQAWLLTVTYYSRISEADMPISVLSLKPWHCYAAVFSTMQVLDRLHRQARADQRQPATKYTTGDVLNVSVLILNPPQKLLSMYLMCHRVTSMLLVYEGVKVLQCLQPLCVGMPSLYTNNTRSSCYCHKL